MRREPQQGSSTLANAAMVVAIGSAASACSGELRPVEGTSDAAGDETSIEASIDEGAPDVGVDQWQLSGVDYGPLTCTEDSECGPGQRCDTSHAAGICVAAPIVGPDAQDAPADQNALDISVDRGVPPDGASDRDAFSVVDDGVPDAGVACDSSLSAIVYGPMSCSDDAACVQRFGSGYWCDSDAGITDSCGRFLSWPQCLPGNFASDASADATPRLDSGSGED